MADYKSKHAESEIAGRVGDSPANFNWGKALKGAVGGFMMGGPVGALAGGAISGFSGKKKTVEEKVEAVTDQKVEEKVEEETTKAVNKTSGKDELGYNDARL